MALPGIPQWRNLRIPFARIEHKVLCENTFNQIFDILLWRLQSLATGEHHLSRHDNLDWLPANKTRKRLAGKQHGVRAVLVKADWKAPWRDLLVVHSYFAGHEEQRTNLWTIGLSCSGGNLRWASR